MLINTAWGRYQVAIFDHCRRVFESRGSNIGPKSLLINITCTHCPQKNSHSWTWQLSLSKESVFEINMLYNVVKLHGFRRFAAELIEARLEATSPNRVKGAEYE